MAEPEATSACTATIHDRHISLRRGEYSDHCCSMAIDDTNYVLMQVSVRTCLAQAGRHAGRSRADEHGMSAH